MASHHSTRFPSRKSTILLVLLCAFIVLTLVFQHFRTSLSPYTGHSSNEFVCSSQQTQYPINTDQITISISNTGDYSGELEKPHLEVLKGNTWHIIITPQEDMTSNLLTFPPGCTDSFDLFLSQYQPNLTPGRYRAVFPFWQSSEFFSFDFELY